jgi:hypothetical protein
MQLRQVDHSALRVTQVFTIVLLLVAFIFNALWLAAAVAVLNAIAALNPALSLPRRVYLDLLKPSGLVKPHVIEDNPEPHRFAQGLGAVFTAVGTLLALAGIAAGWAFIWLVIGLASLNLFLGFCAGCFMYYQFNRLGVPGFTRSPVKRG